MDLSLRRDQHHWEFHRDFKGRGVKRSWVWGSSPDTRQCLGMSSNTASECIMTSKYKVSQSYVMGSVLTFF